MTPRRRSRSVRAGTGALSLRLGTRQELVVVKNKFSTSTTSDIITSHVIRRDDASPECCVSTCKIKKQKTKPQPPLITVVSFLSKCSQAAALRERSLMDFGLFAPILLRHSGSSSYFSAGGEVRKAFCVSKWRNV